MSPSNQNYHNPSTPNGGYPDQNSKYFEDDSYHSHSHNPQSIATPNSVPQASYTGAVLFDDEMVAEIQSRERRHVQTQEPEDFDNNDYTDDDEDSYAEDVISKTKSALKRKVGSTPTPKSSVPRPSGSRSQTKKPAKKDPAVERQKLAAKNIREIDEGSGRFKNRGDSEDEEHEYDDDDIKEIERDMARHGTPAGMALDAHGRLVNKNGRVKGRKLVLWHRPRMIEKLVLHMQYELHRRGVDIPWGAIVHRLSPGSSGQSATQQLNKLRDALVSEGHLVPPLLGKINQSQDAQIRGYLRDENSNDITQTRVVFWEETVEDRKESIVNPGVVRGSGNYRKNPMGRGLDKVVKASKGESERRSRQPEFRHPASSGKRIRNSRFDANVDLEEEVELEAMETPSKRQKSIRPTRGRAAHSTNNHNNYADGMLKLKVPSEILGLLPHGESGPRDEYGNDDDLSPEIKKSHSPEDSASDYKPDTSPCVRGKPSTNRGKSRQMGVYSAPHQQTTRYSNQDHKIPDVSRRLFSPQTQSSAGNLPYNAVKPRNHQSREAIQQHNTSTRQRMADAYRAKVAGAGVNMPYGSMNSSGAGFAAFQNGHHQGQFGGNVPHGMMYSGHAHPSMAAYQYTMNPNVYDGMGNTHHGLPAIPNPGTVHMNGGQYAHNSGYARAPVGHYYANPNLGSQNGSVGNAMPNSSSRMHARQTSNNSERPLRNGLTDQVQQCSPQEDQDSSPPLTQASSASYSDSWQAPVAPHQLHQQPVEVQSFENMNAMNSIKNQDSNAQEEVVVNSSPHENAPKNVTTHSPYENAYATQSQYENVHESQQSTHSQYDDVDAAQSISQDNQDQNHHDDNPFTQEMQQGELNMSNHEQSGQAGEFLDDANHSSEQSEQSHGYQNEQSGGLDIWASGQ